MFCEHFYLIINTKVLPESCVQSLSINHNGQFITKPYSFIYFIFIYTYYNIIYIRIPSYIYESYKILYILHGKNIIDFPYCNAHRCVYICIYIAVGIFIMIYICFIVPTTIFIFINLSAAVAVKQTGKKAG